MAKNRTSFGSLSRSEQQKNQADVNVDLKKFKNSGSLNWIGDDMCDDATNNAACEYDGGDCCGDSVNGQVAGHFYPRLFNPRPKPSLKIWAACAICWNYLGLFKDNGLDHIVF